MNQSEKGGESKKQFLKSTAKGYFVCSAQQMNQQPRVQATKLCTFSQDLHHIGKCFKFMELFLEERHSIAKESDLCFNCLMQDHRAVNCRSKLSCRKCGKKHNTLLHFESKQNSKCVSAPKESVSDEEMCSNNIY